MAVARNGSLDRRQFALGTALGASSLLFASAGASGQAPGGGDSWIDARKLGAAGDGQTDDTAALQRALDAAGKANGSVFLPPGVYRTGELRVREGVALIGIPAWNYSGPGGSVLELADDHAACLLNLTEARGATLQGLALDGRDLGKGIHGIATLRANWGSHEDSFRIEQCQAAHFSGDGVHLECAWCFSVRHSMLAFNAGDGLSLRGWDGFLIDNWFSGNGRAGFAARQENASVTFTANRVEWNGQENLLVTAGDGYQITGNFFDRAGTIGVALRKAYNPCRQVAFTGNFIKRSGRYAASGSEDSAHLLLEECEGAVCTGNTLESGRDDGSAGKWSPAYGIVYRGLRNCVVKNNVLHDGALKQLLLDRGGNAEGAVIADNPGRLFTDGNHRG